MRDPNAGPAAAGDDDAQAPREEPRPDVSPGASAEPWDDAWADAQWSQIVAGWGDARQPGTGPDAAGPGPAGSGPAGPDAAGRGPDDARPAAGPASPGGTGHPADPFVAIDAAPWVRRPGPRDWPTSDEVLELEDAETHFTPPEPPPLFGRDPLANLAWVALVASVVVLVLALVVLRPVPSIVPQVCLAVFVAAVGVLVWRLPRSREDPDDPGARV